MPPPHTLPDPPSLAELMHRGPVALFLDFDGTLIDIAPAPELIDVPDDLAQKLSDLADRMDGRFALVSGRSPADLDRHLGSLPFAVAGSHGMARFRADGSALGKAAASLPPAAIAAIRQFADDYGLNYERKSHGGALHFRSSPDLENDAARFAHEVAQRHGLEVKTGKYVVEIVGRGADKAAAVSAFMTEHIFAGAMPVFIGDDVTDEDGFRAADALHGFGIAVGERRSACARFKLNNVKDVHAWLKL